MFGNSTSRYGTIIVDKDEFGEYYHNFNSIYFEEWANEFVKQNDFTIPKTEGVSGLISKQNWDRIGGNDSQFAPTSWEDMDLFLRMYEAGYQFILTSKSMVWHFGARGSHRLEENNGQSDLRQVSTERLNQEKFYKKWGGFPKYNKYGLIIGVK
jgi:GT2 family glycosyltransferase